MVEIAAGAEAPVHGTRLQYEWWGRFSTTRVARRLAFDSMLHAVVMLHFILLHGVAAFLCFLGFLLLLGRVFCHLVLLHGIAVLHLVVLHLIIFHLIILHVVLLHGIAGLRERQGTEQHGGR